LFVRLLFLALALQGCVYDELTSTHIEPGGALHAAIDSGPMHTTTAICNGHQDPANLTGYAADVTFGLVAGADATGSNAFTDLGKGTYTFDVPITPSGTSQLSVHAEGSGCAAQSGTVHLVSDGSHLSGNFTGSGTRTDSGAACMIAGDFSGIPLDR
jgi:hypothetical protein